MYISICLCYYIVEAIMKIKKYAEVGPNCVSCGNCVPSCPVGAIEIKNGIRAVVDELKCIGCGKCAKVCPAGIIDIHRIEVAI